MADLDRSSLTTALRALGDVLAARGHTCDLVLVGGAALLLRGTVSRPTKDGDIIGERRPDGTIARLDHLPPELARAAADVGRAYGLADDWLNLGPASLLDGPLPEGFEERLSLVEFGALRLWARGPCRAQALGCGRPLAGARTPPRRPRGARAHARRAPERRRLDSPQGPVARVPAAARGAARAARCERG